MITYVGSENLSGFEPLLTPEALDGAAQPNTLIYGAIDDDTKLACGAAALAASQTQAGLTSLYVTPGRRRKGYARAMLTRLIEQARQAGITGITAAYELPEEQAGPLEACLSAMGFQKAKPSPVYAAVLGDLQKAEALGKAAAGAPGVMSMAQVPKSWIFDFNGRQQESDDFVFEPIDPDEVDLELSTVIVENNVVRGGIWISRDGEEYTIEGLYVPKSYGSFLAPALGRSLNAAATLPADTVFRFVAVNPMVEKLLTRLFPEAKPVMGAMEAMELILTR